MDGTRLSRGSASHCFSANGLLAARPAQSQRNCSDRFPRRLGNHTLPGSSPDSAYVAMLNALILLERSRGTTALDLDERWKTKLESSGEENWRDTAIWLLAGHAKVFDIRTFYHHLKEACGAGQEQVKDIKHAFAGIRRQAIGLLDELKYCSPLGPMLLSLRRTRRHAQSKSVGRATIKRLEDAGVTSLRQLAELSEAELVGMGIRRQYAAQITDYIRRAPGRLCASTRK